MAPCQGRWEAAAQAPKPRLISVVRDRFVVQHPFVGRRSEQSTRCPKSGATGDNLAGSLRMIFRVVANRIWAAIEEMSETKNRAARERDANRDYFSSGRRGGTAPTSLFRGLDSISGGCDAAGDAAGVRDFCHTATSCFKT